MSLKQKHLFATIAAQIAPLCPWKGEHRGEGQQNTTFQNPEPSADTSSSLNHTGTHSPIVNLGKSPSHLIK